MTDAEWNATLREGERQARIAAALAYLVRCEGAVLYWQVPQELQQGDAGCARRWPHCVCGGF